MLESLEIPLGQEAAARRRVQARLCYLNPNCYQTYRHAFLRASFKIVDRLSIDMITNWLDWADHGTTGCRLSPDHEVARLRVSATIAGR